MVSRLISAFALKSRTWLDVFAAGLFVGLMLLWAVAPPGGARDYLRFAAFEVVAAANLVVLLTADRQTRRVETRLLLAALWGAAGLAFLIWR